MRTNLIAALRLRVAWCRAGAIELGGERLRADILQQAMRERVAALPEHQAEAARIAQTDNGALFQL